MKKYESLLKRAEEFEKLAVYGDRTTFLQAIAQVQDPYVDVRNKIDEEYNQSLPRTIPAPPPATPGKVVTWQDLKTKEPDAQTQTQAPTAAKTTPTISKETQDQLNQILVPYGKILPLQLDGILGPQTQKAIEEFKKTYSKPGTPAAIKEVYLQVKNPGIVTKAPF